MPGPGLGCGQAVAVALELLPDGHPRIEGIDFIYDCDDVNAISDCAIQFMGRVRFMFEDGEAPNVEVNVYPAPDGGFVGRIR